MTLEEGVEVLLEANFRLNSPRWHYLLWDPVNRRMVVESLNLATSYLLHQVGKQAPTRRQQEQLRSFLGRRSAEQS